MNRYTIELFVHVSGAIGVFAGIATWLFGFAALWRARRVEQVRDITTLMVWSGSIAFAGIVLLAVAGIDMALTAWGGVRAVWIDVATVSAFLLGLIGAFVGETRVRALWTLARTATDGPLPEALEERTHDPLLGTGLFIYVTGLFGIVFLMTNKPELTDSLVVMLVALALGVASSLPLWPAARRRARGVSGRVASTEVDPF
jgi:hypothetical protein